MTEQQRPRRPRVHRGAAAAGAAFTGLGVLFLLEALGVFRIAPGVLWPLLIIVLGAGLVVSGTGREHPPPVPPGARHRT